MAIILGPLLALCHLTTQAEFRSNPCCGIKAGLPFHFQDSTIQSQRSASHCGLCQSRQRQQTTNIRSSCGVWIRAECGGGRSPVPVQEQQQGDARGRGQDGAHPETQLAEVAVLYDGQYGGAAQEHHHLRTQTTKHLPSPGRQGVGSQPGCSTINVML